MKIAVSDEHGDRTADSFTDVSSYLVALRDIALTTSVACVIPEIPSAAIMWIGSAFESVNLIAMSKNAPDRR